MERSLIIALPHDSCTQWRYSLIHMSCSVFFETCPGYGMRNRKWLSGHVWPRIGKGRFIVACTTTVETCAWCTIHILFLVLYKTENIYEFILLQRSVIHSVFFSPNNYFSLNSFYFTWLSFVRESSNVTVIVIVTQNENVIENEFSRENYAWHIRNVRAFIAADLILITALQV